MKAVSTIPEKIRERFLEGILEMYSNGELSASKTSQMLGVPTVTFYKILAETTSLPKKLNESIRKELKELVM
jgi:predicted HTH domain antitoxin